MNANLMSIILVALLFVISTLVGGKISGLDGVPKGEFFKFRVFGTRLFPKF